MRAWCAGMGACMDACVRVRVRAGEGVRMRACIDACVCGGVCACMHACVHPCVHEGQVPERTVHAGLGIREGGGVGRDVRGSRRCTARLGGLGRRAAHGHAPSTPAHQPIEKSQVRERGIPHAAD